MGKYSIQWVKDSVALLARAAELYVNSFSEEPWKENYSVEKVIAYFRRFQESESNLIYVLLADGKPTGVVLLILIPTYQDTYARIEDFCVDSREQRKGNGSVFLELLKEELRGKAIGSIVLNTVKDFPSYSFYRKNGFQHIENSACLYGETK
jgi:aminoglycoside 6'-N-acetyltransferase I